MENIDFEKWSFSDVYDHWKAETYGEVQNAFDVPYNRLPAPSKIPAGALEFDIAALGEIKSVELDVKTARSIVKWESGAKLTTFVHAERPVGWYKFENLEQLVKIEMKSPAYTRKNTEAATSQSRNDLNQLGYEHGEIIEAENSLTYNQKGWGDFSYQISTQWEADGSELTVCWSVSSANKG